MDVCKATGVPRQIWDLFEAAQAQTQCRAVERRGQPAVSIDNLDRLDELPDDTF